MSLLTTATRNWLTRSFKPFTFVADDGRSVPELSGITTPGLYVHIPFCRSICNFCPYCKVRFDSDLCQRYIESLKQEIELVSAGFPTPETVSSLYFGGGSPALAADRIGEIIAKLQTYYRITDGIGVELHPLDVNAETLLKLKSAGVTRISIGIQSFQEKFQNMLGRGSIDPAQIKQALACVNFETVSMDFIFALPGQSAGDLKRDIQTAFDCGANHIAILPYIRLSIFPLPRLQSGR